MSTTHHPTRRKQLFYFLFIFCVAFLIRVVYLAESKENPTFDSPIVDAATYNRLACDFVKTKTLTEEFFFQPFFYPFFLALFYSVFGCSILKVKLFQVLLGASTCALTYLTGEQLIDRRTGLLAGLIAAGYGPLIFFDAELLGSGWAAFWAILLIYLLTKRDHPPHPPSYLLTGAVMMLSIVTRPTFLPFCIATGALTVWQLLHRYSISRKTIICTGLLVIGCLAVALPVAVTSYRVTGNFSILPNSGGVNLYIGNNPDTEQSVLIRPGIDWKKLTRQPYIEGAKTSKEANAYFYVKYKNYILSDPFHFINGLANKFIKFINSREIPRNINIYIFREWSPTLAFLVWKIKNFGFPFGVLLPLAVVGVLNYRRQRIFQPYLFMVLYAAAVIMVFISSRYRIPTLPILIIFAASGSLFIYNAVKTKSFSNLWMKGIAALVAVCFTIIPGPYTEEKVNYTAEMYCGVGEHWKTEKQFEQALHFFRKAIQLNPGYAEAYYNIGNIYEIKEDYQKAIKFFQTSLSLRPDYAIVHNNLAIALETIGDISGAIKHYEKAMQINPVFFSAAYNLGMVLMISGRPAEALPNFEKAIALQPKNAEYHYKAGIAATALEKHETAAYHFSQTIDLAPENASAFFNLAIIRGLQGRTAMAIAMYKKALSINPSHDKARLNLGLTLAETGDYDEAILQFRKLITAHPDNAEFHHILGTIFLQRGQIKSALSSIQRAVKLSPDLTPAYYSLGLACIAAGDLQGATSAWQSLRNQNSELSAKLKKQMRAKFD